MNFKLGQKIAGNSLIFMDCYNTSNYIRLVVFLFSKTFETLFNFSLQIIHLIVMINEEKLSNFIEIYSKLTVGDIRRSKIT